MAHLFPSRIGEARALIDVYIGAHTDILMKLQQYIDDDDDDDETEDQLAQLKVSTRVDKSSLMQLCSNDSIIPRVQ